MIRVEPGPWHVDNERPGNEWGIINEQTGQTKYIGRVQWKGVNYFDRAKAEAKRRNPAPYVLNGDGWEPDQENSKGGAEEALLCWVLNEMEAEKITVTRDGRPCGVNVTVEVYELDLEPEPTLDDCLGVTP